MKNMDKGLAVPKWVLIKASKSRKQILKFSFEPKTNENIFIFLP